MLSYFTFLHLTRGGLGGQLAQCSASSEGGDLVLSRYSLRSRLGGRGAGEAPISIFLRSQGRTNPERPSRMGADCPSALLPQSRSGNFKLCPKNKHYHLVILKESPFPLFSSQKLTYTQFFIQTHTHTHSHNF